jgi:hypothetical protein
MDNADPTSVTAQPVAHAQSARRVLGEPGVHSLGGRFGREGRDEQAGVEVVRQ